MFPFISRKHGRCAYLNKMLIFFRGRVDYTHSVHDRKFGYLLCVFVSSPKRMNTRLDEHESCWLFGQLTAAAVKQFSRCFGIKFRERNSGRECRTYRLEYYREPSRIVCQIVQPRYILSRRDRVLFVAEFMEELSL